MTRLTEDQATRLLYSIWEAEPDEHGPNMVEAWLGNVDASDAREDLRVFLDDPDFPLPEVDPASIIITEDVDDDSRTPFTRITILIGAKQ